MSETNPAKMCAETVMWAIDNLVRIVGPIFVCVVWVLISGIVWGWHAVLRPYLTHTEGVVGLVLHALFAHWLLINVCYHYYKGSTKPPGTAPIVTKEVYTVATDQNYNCCKKCETVKPLRAHHCSVCKGCVLKMDHHCPWLNNCVGHENHRHFFLFMWYIWCGVWYVAAVAYGPYNARTELRRRLRKTGEMRHWREELVHEGLPVQAGELSFLFVLSSAVIVSLGLLIFWHIYLISTAQTTIEFYKNIAEAAKAKKRGKVWRNPYSLGSAKKNWMHFLGVGEGPNGVYRHWSVLLWPNDYPSFGDGLHWEYLKKAADTGFKTLDV